MTPLVAAALPVVATRALVELSGPAVEGSADA